MQTKQLVSILAAVSLLAGIGLAATGSVNAASPVATAAAPAQWLSIAQVHDKLVAAGYRDVEKIERKEGRYKVKATNRDGQRVKLYLHAQTGAVLDMTRRNAQHDSRTRRDGVECSERRCRDDLPTNATPAGQP